MRVEAAKVNPEDCRQEVSVNIMMRRRATCASYGASSPATHPLHST